MPSSTASCEPARVLLVDDNEALLERAAAVIRHGCVVVGTARNGCAALEAAGKLQPDVIVLDIAMPGMSGLEVAIRLRDAGCTAAVVFLTVHGDDEFIEAAAAAGGLGYVVKPRLTADLIHAIHEARAGRRFISAIR